MKKLLALSLAAALILLSACSSQSIVDDKQEISADDIVIQDPTTENKDETDAATEEKAMNYDDYYRQALDEEYWADIPDTPEEEFVYDIVSTSGFPDEIKEQIAKRQPDGQLPNRIVQITDYTGTSETVKVPVTIEGYPVDSFNQKDGVELKELYIPDSVECDNGIGASCSTVTKLRIPQNAFGIYAVNNLYRYTQLDTLALYGAFDGSTSVRLDFTSDEFYPETNLQNLYLHSGVREIEVASAPPKSLKYFGIPSSVKRIYVEDWGITDSGKQGRIEKEADVFNGSDVTIVCQEGSYAQEYAEKYGVKTLIVE